MSNTKHVLKLNADYTACAVVNWEAAVELLLTDKAICVASVPDKFVRSEHLAMMWPSVIALKKYRVVRGRIKFSGKNVILRDRGICNYCGAAPKAKDGGIDRTELTMDHVIPRAQGKLDSGAVYLPWSKKWVGVTSWENATCACKRCNSWKADRTPEQAGMSLRVFPRTPTGNDVMRIALSKIRVLPEEWLPYLPEGLVVLSDSKTQDLESGKVIKIG